MIINKEDCTFTILSHNVLNTALGMAKMIEMEFNINNEKYKMFYTNAGWKEHNERDWFCPKKFGEVEAEKFLYMLEDHILI